MANVGLRKPYVAKYDRQTKRYSDGFRYSHAVSMGITPNYAEASLYGDDSQQEYEKQFTNAAVTLGTTSTPLQAASTMFGHTIEGKKVIYKTTDEANYVGIGITGVEKIDGKSQYVALIILCAKFTDSAENYQTKGDQIQFNTPSIEGAAIAADDEGNWKITKIFDTAEEADAFVRDYLNISDTPTTTYTVTQNLTNVTSDFSDETVDAGEALEITLEEESGYTLSEPVITIGGVDITATAWNATTQKITIASVTGNVVITAAATE
ncbi:MAG: hypothetical protein J6Y57_01130 [Lachnospiraceae bacterium]|nr:hypothetical protein [Lachnospiraceae bacterium]